LLAWLIPDIGAGTLTVVDKHGLRKALRHRPITAQIGELCAAAVPAVDRRSMARLGQGL
jgi:hypothetical protein